MRGLLVFLITFFAGTTIQAQISVEGGNSHDMGDIKAGDSRLADFRLLNRSNEEVFFLRADLPEDCVIKYSSNPVLPDSIAIIRIKFNPIRRGDFKRSIKVYVSSQPEPLEFFISGNVKELEENSDYHCPDFNTPVAQKQPHQEVIIQVVDASSFKPISSAAIKYNPIPRLLPVSLTDQEGMVSVDFPIGLYDIEATAKGYLPDKKNFYIGKQTTSVMLLLEPQNQPVAATIDQPGEYIPRDAEPPAPVTEPPYVEKPGELPYSEYVPNNVVFLIDVSSSMGYPDKLPLLKESMKSLLGNLRSIDRISIVTYASGTEVVMQSTTAEKKDKISNKIDKLEAFGTTEGGKGIREAYKVAQENYIPGGNNQIIIATDGDFNLDKSDGDLFRFIEKNSEQITLSVVGCGQKQRAIEKMQKIAESGRGSYIHISTAEQAESNLVDEVKLRSKRTSLH